ncbi:MAG: phage scaffolding protein [Oscillospiraceae bacterium]
MNLAKIFGDKPLTHDEFILAIGKAGVKLVDLSEGGYVSKDKYDTETKDLNTRLTEANTKLTGYDPEWQAKADTAEQNAKQKITELEFNYALTDALKDAKSKNPTAVKALLKMEGLDFDEFQIRN